MFVLFIQPCLEGYRNKCEFSIGTGITSGQVVVGFRLGSFEEGDSYLTIVSAEDCVHIPERAKELAKVVTKEGQGVWFTLSEHSPAI